MLDIAKAAREAAEGERDAALGEAAASVDQIEAECQAELQALQEQHAARLALERGQLRLRGEAGLAKRREAVRALEAAREEHKAELQAASPFLRCLRLLSCLLVHRSSRPLDASTRRGHGLRNLGRVG